MKTKVLIIGGGPIGLYTASKLKDYLLIEANDFLGGQITNLYPKKEIVDIPGINNILAEDYIKLLISKINMDNVHLSEKVINIIPGKEVKVITNKDEYLAEKVIIATGLGFTTPRPLGIEQESECKNILYSLKDYSFLKNKRVAIFGGGDSALDWAKAVSNLSNNVSLIHRRTEFRGNPDTIKDCKNLKLYLPYIPYSLKRENDKAISITIKLVSEEKEEYKTIDVDYILVNYGNIAQLPDFAFEKEGSFLKVNEKYALSENIFAIGDTCAYENKKRRIAPGNMEADAVLKLIS